MSKLKLKQHQVDSLNFAREARFSICGNEMGTGKTAVALSLSKLSKGKTLVVCPAFLKKNWKNECELWGASNVEITSYAGLKKFKSRKITTIIADEAHYLKNPKAKRTEYFHELVKSMDLDYMILLTGTPIKNSVVEFWSLLQLCHYGGRYVQFDPYHRLYYKFANTFSYERTFEVNRIPIVRFEGVKNVDKLKELIKPVYYRVKAKDVLDLPESSIINFRAQAKTNKDVLHFLNEMLLREGKMDSISDDPAYMSMKRANAMIKVETTIKLAKEMLEQGEKVVIFSDHVQSCRKIADELGVKAITGSMNTDERANLVENYEKNVDNVICATIGALSTGVNLTSANKMIFNDYPFVPADMEQAMARIKRIGQTKKCFYYFILSSETDQNLLDKLNRKTRDIGKVI